MEAVKFVALLLLVAVQVFGALGFSSDEEDGEVWMVQNWRLPPAAKSCCAALDYPLQKRISIQLADLIKRSKAQQFHGLMGRSSGASRSFRLGRERNKGEMFVGLMGKRTLGGDLVEYLDSDDY